MKKSLCLKLLSFMFIFFIFLGDVSAKSAFTEMENSSDIYSNCNPYIGDCVPLCIYKGDHEGDEALIGYHFETGEWEITFSNHVEKFKDIYTVFSIVDDSIPTKSIFWGSSVNWYGSDGYDQLSEKLKCPSFFYPDEYSSDEGSGSQEISLSDHLDEVCFSDVTGECEKSSGFKTSFNAYYTLSSSFINEEFDTASENVYNELHYDEDINADKIDKAKLIIGEDKYVESMSADQNVESNCDDLRKSINNFDLFISNITNGSYYSSYKDLLSSTFKKNVVRSNVNNPKFYTYENLKSLMIYNVGSELKYRNAAFEKIDSNLIYENTKSSLDYVSSVCSINVGQENLDKLKTKIFDGFNSQYSAKIILEDQYDCSFLSGVANLIGTAYFIIEMLAVIIFIAFSILDYARVIMSGEADELRRVNTRFLNRIIIVILIFLLPALVNLTLKIFKIEGFNSDNPLCVKISNK